MKRIIFIPCLFLLFTACKKNVVEPTATSSEPTALYQKLQEAGFSKEHIKDIGKYYLVEGDMLFDKNNTDMDFFDEYFKDQPSATGDKSGARHFVTPTQVSQYNIENMKMDIAEFNFGDEILDWKKSSATAMGYWAGIANTSINFVRYPSSYGGDRFINVVDDAGTLPDNVIAAAEFPSSGNPGFQIRINLDFLSNMTVSSGQRVYNLVHELGHCIGFRHSDLANYTEAQNGAIAIPTTSAGIDNFSVMKAGTALNSWAGFSSDDIVAAQSVYPVGLGYSNWLTSPNSGKYPGYSHYFILDYSDPINITWNASLVSTPTVTLQVFQNGVFKQTIGIGIPNTGSYSYPIMNVVGNGAHSAYEIQVKIISDASSFVTDFSSMFDIVSD
ncbi:hypothetical protein A4H97_32645 [Niastella yeongjuensis]|uniref:Peptidase metallopeptidase domain-containing protein n=1 Tax=Niastella yeongjuensis TaxID=354355 RepID=A0A1V9EGK1_9BACT|nr:M57 family metalloprotease [Niastella yeongjuensis]OQP45269.1 hypothetical protein A4H97_32645 [Niastella yeongjuensis]SEO27741.1 Dual-action HEIGH metallo-peptidase [Niastella yeongjuensis]